MQLRDEIANVKRQIHVLQAELELLEASLDEEEEQEADDRK